MQLDQLLLKCYLSRFHTCTLGWECTAMYQTCTILILVANVQALFVSDSLTLTESLRLAQSPWKSQSWSEVPFRNCLPGTQLFQSPLRMEFSMGSLSWPYRQSLRRHRRFLRSYRRSLRRCRDPWGDRRQRGRQCRSLRNSLNIVKHC